MNSNHRCTMGEVPTPSNPSATCKIPRLGLCALLLAGFITMFDLFVVNVAIPSIQTGLGASFAQIGFILTGYQLSFGALLITGGRLGDLFGRRRLFIMGMAGFTFISALCGLAPDTESLIGARVFQGATAALLFPQIYASIRVNNEGDSRRRIFGLLGMTLGLAAIAGQVLGGWLVHADVFGLSWRSIFLINIPIGIVAILAARYIPESISPQRSQLDWSGVALISIGLALLLIPLMEGAEQGWPAWSQWSLGGAVAVLLWFYRQQERQRHSGREPLVDMQLMAQKRFALGALLVLLIYSTSSSFFLCFALLVQTGLGLDAFAAGSIFAPCSAGFVLASLVAPRLMARWGIYAIVTGALIYALAIAMLIMQVWMVDIALKPAMLIPVLIVVGAGQGAIMTPLLNLVLGFVDADKSGMASGVISTVQQIGAALGVAIVGILFNATLSGTAATSQIAQYSSAFVAGMLYNLGAAVLACVLLFFLAKVNEE
ncbi:MFS transporter [Carnimonas nigrificans]|uniref:MFS transporter n=1 Tax=Carnimonas nigrificans TaxID=64323 RepID=UPI000472968E|nr:MFS transporter [Carnimonas nigrificans]